MQAWRMRALLVAIVVLLPFEIVLIVALWPYLPWVGKAFMGFLVTCFVCGSAAVIDWAWKRIKAPIIIVERDVVVMLTKTGYAPLSAEHESAKLIAAPVQVTEMPRELSASDKEIIDRSRVLAAHFEEGKGMHAIEKELGIPYNQVRDWCNTAKALRAQQKSW